MGSPTKRPRDDFSHSASSDSITHDYDETPRPVKSHRPSLSGRTPSQRSAASSSRISPKKQLSERQNKPAPITVLQYAPDEARVPASLREIWREMARFSKGTKVIAKRLEADINTQRATYPQLDTIESWYYDDDAKRDELGPSPSVAQVLSVLDAAKVCSNEGYCEASWNMVVHLRVMQLAVPLYAAGSEGKVSFMPCPTAKIIDKYTDTRGPSRRVDFCMLLEPEAHAAEAIRAIQYQDDLLSMSINHTNYAPLRRRPIGLSIETKGHDEGLGDAKTQLLIWFAAQWQSLERLAHRLEPLQPLPDFLPGVIIEGHQWYFVASTKDKSETILWMKQLIGSTEEAIGVYSIVCALQYLSRWIRTVYWPVFQRYLLPPQPA
ncbi:uncharacterized protein CTRU02_215214 [Colletotrichum truncatum]|uniref:Uncharacterized protein n=1 Tax=Colletotrichum truncatum TaxID=5467 RepID=A0ACC3YD51_COLTU